MQADARQLPFPSAVFDALLCVAAIPYLPDFGAAILEWCRVGRPGAVRVFTTAAAEGILVHRLLRRAAEMHRLSLPDPHAALGTEDRIRAFVESFGLTLTQAERHSFVEPLGDQPRAAFDTVIDYGFADPLRAASHDLREAIFETYAAAHQTADDAGEGDQILFSRCQLPEHRSSVPATNAYQPSRTPAAPTSASTEASTSGS